MRVSKEKIMAAKVGVDLVRESGRGHDKLDQLLQGLSSSKWRDHLEPEDRAWAKEHIPKYTPPE